MENEKLRAYVQENGRVTIQNTAGRTLVQEFVRDRTVRGTNFSAMMIPARDFKPVPGGGYALTVRFESDPEEKLFGMGQYQQEIFNLKGTVLELAHRNARVQRAVLPDRGYGFCGTIRRSARHRLARTARSGAPRRRRRWITG